MRERKEWKGMKNAYAINGTIYLKQKTKKSNTCIMGLPEGEVIVGA